jgi:hypothetical protein
MRGILPPMRTCSTETLHCNDSPLPGCRTKWIRQCGAASGSGGIRSARTCARPSGESTWRANVSILFTFSGGGMISGPTRLGRTHHQRRGGSGRCQHRFALSVLSRQARAAAGGDRSFPAAHQALLEDAARKGTLGSPDLRREFIVLVNSYLSDQP